MHGSVLSVNECFLYSSGVQGTIMIGVAPCDFAPQPHLTACIEVLQPWLHLLYVSPFLEQSAFIKSSDLSQDAAAIDSVCSCCTPEAGCWASPVSENVLNILTYSRRS